MASHDVPRSAIRTEWTPEALRKELEEIQQYQQLVEEVNQKVEAKDFTPELLQKTAALLKRNPEYYTVWNHRRRIYVQEFLDLSQAVAQGEKSNENRQSEILDIIQLDLQFLFPLLIKYPKCYWIWNHRLWLLEQSTSLLPTSTSRKLWEEELGLVGKMLSRDNRNFHGWGYRRTVVQSLESPALQGESMVRGELGYTKKMIGSNLSNFSAWHNRIKLILRVLEEEKADDAERQKVLDEELKLIHQALFDPYDQSLWFYHQNLMCTLDPEQAAKGIAPNLSNEERLRYIAAEQEYIEEVLEDAEDCKWAYLALIESTLIESKVKGGLTTKEQGKMSEWVSQLQKLDPLRKGRWLDLEKRLKNNVV